MPHFSRDMGCKRWFSNPLGDILTAVRIEVVGDIHECTTGNKIMTSVEERHFGGQGVILIVEG